MKLLEVILKSGFISCYLTQTEEGIKGLSGTTFVLTFLSVFLFIEGCSQTTKPDSKIHAKAESGLPANNPATANIQSDSIDKVSATYKVTFIELGSVRCIPCQKMQTVMKSVKEKFGDQVNVVFYDVWTPEGRPFGQQYGIQAIPTQVFLDENGKEFSRHEGYFPEEELVKVLNEKGVR
jgi:thioredoxin 1